MPQPEWVEFGAVDELNQTPLPQVTVKKTKLALIPKNREFSAIPEACNHVGGFRGGDASWIPHQLPLIDSYKSTVGLEAFFLY